MSNMDLVSSIIDWESRVQEYGVLFLNVKHLLGERCRQF